MNLQRMGIKEFLFLKPGRTGKTAARQQTDYIKLGE